MKHLSVLLISATLLLLPGITYGQHKVDIKLNEKGEVEEISSFLLKKNKKNKVSVEIKGLKAKKAIFNDTLAVKFNKTKEKLKKDSDFYQFLWGDSYDSLLLEIDSIDLLLKGGKLDPAGPDFKYLNNRAFYSEWLSSNHIKINGNKVADNSSGKAVYTIKDLSEKDELELKIAYPDYKKLFSNDYFQKTKDEHAAVFKGVLPAKYDSAFKNLKSLDSSILKKITAVASIPEEYICDSILISEVEQLGEEFNKNYLVELLRSDWVKGWIWINNGNITLNPVGYVDVEKLQIEAPDYSEEIRDYNLYRQKMLQNMLNTNEIDEEALNSKVFDQFLLERKMGEEVFNKKKKEYIAKTKKEYLQKVGQTRTTHYTATKLELPVVKHKWDKAFLIYNANNKLTPRLNNTDYAIGDNTQVSAIAYNLRPNEKFSVSQDSKDINDESAVASSLKAVGNEIKPITTFVSSSLAGGLLNFGSLTGSKEGIINYNIESKSLVDYIKLKASSVDSISLKDKDKSKDDVQLFELKIVDSIAQELQSKLITDVLHEIKVAYPLMPQCQPLYRSILLSFENQVPALAEEIHTAGLDKLKETLISIKARLLEEAVAKIKSNFAVKDELLVQLNNQRQLIEYIQENKSDFQTPPSEFEPKVDSIPHYHTQVEQLDKHEGAKLNTLTLSVKNAKTDSVIVSRKDSYKSSPKHWFTASLGVGYILNDFYRNEATISNGVLTTVEDEEQWRWIAGLHIHPWRMINTDNRIIWNTRGRDLASRFSVFLGVSFPEPLYNLHTGLGIDLVPGLKLGGGYHFYRFTSYTVQNNEIVGEHSAYVANGPYVSLAITPGALLNLFGISSN